MSGETPKSREIKRLNTPFKFKNKKAYDSEGKFIRCSETILDVRLAVEPMEGILSDDEILEYAPLSKAASKIRLKCGFGNTQDILYINENIPWIFGLFYVILICISIPIIYTKNLFLIVSLLILFIIPLLYVYYIFKFASFKKVRKFNLIDSEKSSKAIDAESRDNYTKEINNLISVFNIKQKVVRELIEKRFEPPQLTYDKFIANIDNCEKLFNIQAESALNIIQLSTGDSQIVKKEINNKINIMNSIIHQVEDLTNELVINMSYDENSSNEIKNLLEDMEKLIDSVKDY